MKKLFTLILMSMMVAFVQAKSITIYVQAEKAPYIWVWETGGVNLTGGTWPGVQMTESTVVKGTSFWYMTFETEKTLNAIFNSGPGAVIAQTSDINDISSDRYFTYNGTNSYQDVSSDFVEVPDAVVEYLALSGNHKADWDTNDIFTALEEGKKFEIAVDLTGVEINDDDPLGERWEFRIRPNGQGSIGVNNAAAIEDPDNVLDHEDPSISNFVVYLDDVNCYLFTITATWAGGADSSKGWTIRIEKGNNTTGIDAVRTANNDTNKAAFNLAGQRVGKNYKGIVVKNGKKFMVK